jgi:hypothetical protein
MRLLPVFALVVTSFAAVPVFADQNAECEMQARIVTRATELRLERKSEKKAVETMMSGQDPDVAEKYIAAVPAIADWVYNGLKRKQLKMDPGAAYFQSCMSQ